MVAKLALMMAGWMAEMMGVLMGVLTVGERAVRWGTQMVAV